MKILCVASALLCAVALGCDSPAPRPPRRGSADPALKGLIDTPVEGSTVGPVFRVAGWAVGPAGVDRVRLYLDDDLVATTPIAVARPDIDAQFPKYAATGPLHGFGTTVDAGARAGFRALRLEAVDKRGAVSHVFSVNIRIEP